MFNFVPPYRIVCFARLLRLIQGAKSKVFLLSGRAYSPTFAKQSRSYRTPISVNRTSLPLLIISLCITVTAAQAASSKPNATKSAQLEKSLQSIQDQARFQTNSAVNLVNDANSKAQDAVARSGNIRSNTDGLVQRLSTVTDKFGRPVYGTDYLEALRQQKYAKANNVEQALNSEAAQTMDVAARRMQAIQEASSSLTDRLRQDASSNSGFAIVPDGTNLYVQNYKATEAPAAIPLKANPKKLESQNALTAQRKVLAPFTKPLSRPAQNVARANPETAHQLNMPEIPNKQHSNQTKQAGSHELSYSRDVRGRLVDRSP